MCFRHKEQYSTWLTIKDLVLNSFKEIKADIKQLQDDIKEMKDGFTPATNQNVSGSVTNNLFKLEKEHHDLQQYLRRNNVEILGLPDIFTGDRLTEKVVIDCLNARHRLFQKESNNQLPKRTIVMFVNRRFAEYLLSKRYISSTLDFNKLRFPRGPRFTSMLTYVGTIKICWLYVKN